ncbi:dTDP-4-dehydrorhamnose reductase [Pusillimonas sp.]|uniref:dTDP-4-dehydrorhamnose reductase n=1 Tax=Pusillimonas sp. TaxID=3040095 RepID=UPI0037C62E64
MKLKVLITGAQGQLAQALLRTRPAYWAVTALGSAQLDISDAAAVRRQVAELHPALILNAAAYNAVDQAEQDRDRAFAVNAHGPLNLARAANDVGARLVHVSTDYVFDGKAGSPYDEQAATHPLNAYGESKLQGEQWVLQEQPEALVVRTAWVYSAAANNFVAAMLRTAQHGRPLRVVDDQTGAPTFAGDLAQAIVTLVAHPHAAGGVHHYTGATGLTRYDFARAIFKVADRIQASEQPVPIPGRDGADRHPDHAMGHEPFSFSDILSAGSRAEGDEDACRLRLLSRIASSEYPSAAVRPAYSVLDCKKIARLGIEPRPLMESLPGVISELLSGHLSR